MQSGPRDLTEEMPESSGDLSERGLILDSAGQTQSGGNQRYLTEDLPEELDEEEETGPQTLES